MWRVEVWDKRGNVASFDNLTFERARRLAPRKVQTKKWDYATVCLVRPGVSQRIGKIFTK